MVKSARRAACALAGAGTIALLGACSSILGFHDLGLLLPDASSDAPDGGGDVVAVPPDAADGGCPHDCLGGACVAGACQPLVLASGLTDPRAIAVDATSVYFSQYTDAHIIKTDKAIPGKDYVVVTANVVGAQGIAVDATGIYFTEDVVSGDVSMCPLAGCGAALPTPVFASANAPLAVALRAPNVFFSESAAVRRVGEDGMNAVALFDGGGGLSPRQLALDDTYVYFTSQLGVARVPQAGGAVERLSSESVAPNAITLASVGVFYSWGDADGALVRMPRAGVDGGPGPAFAAQQRNPQGVVVDASNVYWTNAGSLGTADGVILTCPLTGCVGVPTELARGRARPIFMAIDESAIYWVDNGTGNGDGAVVKLAKP